MTTPPDTGPPPADRPPDRRIGARLLVIGLSIALALVWLIPGVAVTENRNPAPFPEVNRAAASSGELFREIDAALVDRLPVKTTVVSAVGALVVGAGLTPSTNVFRGPDGLPFFGGDFTGACVNEADVAAMQQPVIDLKDRLAAEGAGFVYAVPPDKTTTERVRLGPLADGLLACSDRSRAALESYGAPFFTAWDEFTAATADGDDLYMYGDSHWNYRGGALFSGLLLDRLEADGYAPAGLQDGSRTVDAGTEDHTGDLFTLMGRQRIEAIPVLSTERPGVTTEGEEETVSGLLVQHWSSAGAPMVPGRTLILHDSFFGFNGDLLAPYFEDLTAVPLDVVADPGSLVDGGGYDLVIIQQVQRSVPLFLGDVVDSPWIVGTRAR